MSWAEPDEVLDHRPAGACDGCGADLAQAADLGVARSFQQLMVDIALDMALGCAVISVLPADRDMAALDLKVQFLRAVRYRDKSVRVEAKCVHSRCDRALAEARLTTTDERLCAFATMNSLIHTKQPGPAPQTGPA
jgi:hypothetical protein